MRYVEMLIDYMMLRVFRGALCGWKCRMGIMARTLGRGPVLAVEPRPNRCRPGG
jgi:hypothetical protein